MLIKKTIVAIIFLKTNHKVFKMKQLCCATEKDIKDFLKEEKAPAFRSTQIFEWIYDKRVDSIDEMTNLGKPLKEALAAKFQYPCLKLEQTENSEDHETVKYLWRLKDDKFVESVLIRSGIRRTVCVSTQVGCPARCAFCASGRKGFSRNLTVAEIIEQIVHSEEKPSHIVFMGMGEPLENLDAVLEAIKIITQKFKISHRRVTLSTVGIPEKIRLLANSGLNINLALSLHAPTQELRQKLIPYAKKYPLKDVLQSTDYYAGKTKRDMTYEYILIDNFNSTSDHAKELALLIGRKHITVNIIPYNPIKKSSLKRPSTHDIKNFINILAKFNINATCRYTKGKDITAACGQLAGSGPSS
jgi:23S rRNA (adenine2503-C2)-methyltransferase